MRVRANSRYTFTASRMDIVMPMAYAELVEDGDTVRVINMHGCPKANTMGMAYIETLAGEFIGLCSTGSLSR